MKHIPISAFIIPAAVLVATGAHAAQPDNRYPTKPVRVIVPFAPGGGTDITGRSIAQKLSERLGQTFVVDNRAGANGTIGADLAAKAAPDGYTISMISSSHSVNPSLMKKLPYDLTTDLAPITQATTQPYALVIHPTVAAKSVKDLIALARARPDQLFYSTAGSGSFSHLAVALLGSMSGTRMVDVPYKGGGPATAALVSGEAQLSAGTPASVSTHLGTNRLRLIAVTSDTRLTAFPNTPTVAESGQPGYDYAGWVGVFAPAGLPKPMVDRINAEIGRAMDSPDTKKRLEEFEPWTTTPAQMATRIRQDYDKHSKLMKVAGIKPI